MKIILFVCALFILVCCSSPQPVETPTETIVQKTPEEIEQERKGDSIMNAYAVEEAEITEKLKKRAERDWPNDYSTQEFWIKEQLEAFRYMWSIPDDKIKKKAQQDWPLDFSTQKFWYNEQLDAKERLGK